MKTLFCILFILLSFRSVSSQSTNYIEQTSGVTFDLKSAYAVNTSVAWICGYSGTVLRTTNGGTNWLNVSGNGIPATRLLINIYGIDANTAIAAGYEGANTFVYRTSNAGANWTQVFTESNGFINAVWMITNLNGIMQGDPVGGRWSLWKTTNGGVSWDSTGLYLQQAGSEAGWNNSMHVEPLGASSRVWFGTNNTKVYYSSNYGSSWTSYGTAAELNTYSISQILMGSGELLAGGTNLIRSSNYGTNWSSVTSLGTGNFGGFTGHNILVDNAIILSAWYVRNNSSIYASFSNGANWVSDYTAPSGLYRHISPTPSFNQIGVFWAVRSTGGITKGTYSVGAIEPISIEIPEGYSLSQNYPNPFNPTTNFEFQVRDYGLVKLAVYDAMGREIETLLNTSMKPGTYKADWNASKYTSGVYFYRLTAGDFSETKKMMLIK